MDRYHDTMQAYAAQTLIGRRVLILGMGREGLSTYQFLRRYLPTLPLTAADGAPLEKLNPAWHALDDPHLSIITGDEHLQAVAQTEVVFKSPGITPLLPELQAAIQAGITLTSNTALFFYLCQNPVIGVTGTKGKSTTTALIHHVLTQNAVDAILMGNIGLPPLDRLSQASPNALFVAEFSSYQLDDLRVSPHIAVLQNIAPEHLNWHGSFEAYVNAKTNLVRYQKPDDWLLYNADFEAPRQVATHSAAQKIPFGMDALRDGALWWGGQRVIAVADIPLRGEFNRYNVLPAIIIGLQLGISAQGIAAAIRTFQSLEHRLEPVGVVAGVSYYNDSLCTVPEAAIAAIDAFPEPLVLIAGGFDRGQDYTPLAQKLLAVGEHLRGLVLFPPTGERILAALQALSPQYVPPYALVESMPQAVTLAAEMARSGDVVLLSPASASYGRFADYRDRGEQFKAAVRGLGSS